MSTPEVNATPAAVELAAANQVDLEDVEGTGTDGRVTVDDVRSYVEDSGEDLVPVDQETIDSMRDEADSGDDGEASEPNPETDTALEEYDSTGPKPSEKVPPAFADGELDREDIPEAEYEGEKPALVLAGYWVKLGSDDDVPEEFWGAIAAVVESPWTPVPFAHDSEEEITGYRFDEDKKYLVKLRGASEALIEVPAESIVEAAQDRPNILNYA